VDQTQKTKDPDEEDPEEHKFASRTLYGVRTGGIGTLTAEEAKSLPDAYSAALSTTAITEIAAHGHAKHAWPMAPTLPEVERMARDWVVSLDPPTTKPDAKRGEHVHFLSRIHDENTDKGAEAEVAEALFHSELATRADQWMKIDGVELIEVYLLFSMIRHLLFIEGWRKETVPPPVMVRSKLLIKPIGWRAVGEVSTALAAYRDTKMKGEAVDGLRSYYITDRLYTCKCSVALSNSRFIESISLISSGPKLS
jgi:hypothetical protein